MGGRLGARGHHSLPEDPALAALETGRKVRITPDARRISSKSTPNATSATMYYRMAADKTANCSPYRQKLLRRYRAYASLGPDILENMPTFGAGPYEVPTSTSPKTCLHKTTRPQAHIADSASLGRLFAVEQLIDRLAENFKLSLLEIRQTQCPDTRPVPGPQGIE